MRDILDFLSELALNNNREWFTANKARYDACHKRFVDFTTLFLERLSAIDQSLSTVTAADCIWRIYRDVRFSRDKSPYKTWFGTFPAPPIAGKRGTGGKKSPKGGYYVHLQPGQCMFAAGMWCPEPELLKALRQEIADNYEEVETIMAAPAWKRYFTDFDTYSMLRKVPAGYDANHPHADWLKRKTFTFSTPLTDEQVCAPDFIDLVTDIAAAAKPLNDFLDFTFDLYPV